jgi:hypothetical protein
MEAVERPRSKQLNILHPERMAGLTFDVPERLVKSSWDAGRRAAALLQPRLVCKGSVSEHAYGMWQNNYYYGD